MAIVKLEKVLIAGMKDHKDEVLKLLQNMEVLQIDEKKNIDGVVHTNDEVRKLESILADLAFTIENLKPYAKKRGLLEGPIEVSQKKANALSDSFDYKSVITTCKQLKDKEIFLEQNLSILESSEKSLLPWKEAKVAPKESMESEGYVGLYLYASGEYMAVFSKQLAERTSLFEYEIVHREKTDVYATLVYSMENEHDIKELVTKFQIKEAILPPVMTDIKHALHSITDQLKIVHRQIKEIQADFKKFAAYYESLQIMHDYYKWLFQIENTKRECTDGFATFVITGWAVKEDLTELERSLKEVTDNGALVSIIKTDEIAPVALKNNSLFSPFESVTKLYGLPLSSEGDPTPLLAIFFITFFGLALTDAGYGIIITLLMAVVLWKMKLSRDMRKMVKLLMYGGVFTFIMGMLYGGWFGLDISKAPEFLTTVNAAGEKIFIGQVLNPMKNPITVLEVSLGLGYIQVTFGVLIALYWGWKSGEKKEAILSHGIWGYSLIMLAFLILGMAGVIGETGAMIAKYALYVGMVALVLTQGRDKKSIIGKFFSGVLSLYGFVAYFGDVLSYSRLLALGLATAIVGLAANIVAELVSGIPFIGWLLMIIVLVVGHLFNIVLNALGAFIHSSRLQFVEFFTKFLQGGGVPFAPFKKESSYVTVEETQS